MPTAIRSRRSRVTRTARVLGATSLALATLAIATPTGAADPHDVADARFAAITGPMKPFVVFPDQFGMDANKVTADVPALMGTVDGDREKALVTALAFPRRSGGSQAALDQATELVTNTFKEIGYGVSTQPVTIGDKSMPNVSVEIPGTGCSDKVLVVSAHYDSVTEGNPAADDDATGMAGLFELARALKNNPLPVTVRLVAFSFEEDGLVGSRVMAAGDKAAGTDIVGAVSMDMIGFTKPDIDPLTGLPATYLAMVADPTSAPLAKAFGAAAYTWNPLFPSAAAIIDPNVLPDIFRSDHFSFVMQGYQGLMLTDTANFRNPNYHQVTDTLDTIDWDFVSQSTRTMIAGVATYASSDQNQDGVADLCRPPVDETPTTTTVAVQPAAVAAPVRATPTYTG